MDTEVAEYLNALVNAADGILRDELVGVYAAGSVALDAYRPGRSDVDVALLTAAPLPAHMKHALVAALRHERIPCPARGLELVVYTREAARSGTPAPAFEVELNSGPRMPFRATYDPAERPIQDGHFWYALDRSILHQSGLALRGEPAGTAFADIPEAPLRTLIGNALQWWLSLTETGDDAVLGACRSLARVRHGVWLDKSSAGQKIIDDGTPHAALIAAALAFRNGEGPPPDAAGSRAFQRAVLSEISR